MAKETGKEIANTAGTVPAYFGKVKEMGTESMKPSEIVIPRLKICQALTDNKKDNPDLKDGDIFNSITSLPIEQPAKFVIMGRWASTVWFEGKKLTCQEVIGADGVATRYGIGKDTVSAEDGKPSQNYMILMEQEMLDAIENKSLPFPTIYSAISASIKFARQLNSKLINNSQRGVPIYGQVIKMNTVLDSFKDGDAYMPRFSYDRLVSEEEFKFLEEFYAKCKTLQNQADAHVEKEESEFPESDAPPHEDLGL